MEERLMRPSSRLSSEEPMTPNPDTPLPIVTDTTGLTRGYRVRWRLQYLGFSIFGPADQRIENSPKERLKLERARKVLRAYEELGQPAPDEVVETARRF
ncbi:hypothetical protein [Zafaria sp. J156]|uniref:hypothetical protein n=2 Tax=Zafaria sp. J156 TaxID=3116490 RepID=UPI002E763718|nr:hypothetical protein [Zafaria sp. J156]MEE1621291.1 hypothetical protein [Zafaria sp. J156]